jgi:hypothetical protein
MMRYMQPKIASISLPGIKFALSLDLSADDAIYAADRPSSHLVPPSVGFLELRGITHHCKLIDLRE